MKTYQQKFDPTKILDEHEKEFSLLMDRYFAYNSHTNISAIREAEQVKEKHFKDSLEAVFLLEDLLFGASSKIKQKNNKRKILDIGSGGGFPVLPLAIVHKTCYPEMQFTALDSVAKKTKFITAIKSELVLDNLTVLTNRAEELARKTEHREQYDLVTARAVTELSTLLEYAIPFLKVGAYLLAFKKLDIKEESENASKALKELKSVIIGSYVYNDKQILVIEKQAVTGAKYPRTNQEISKSSL